MMDSEVSQNEGGDQGQAVTMATEDAPAKTAVTVETRKATAPEPEPEPEYVLLWNKRKKLHIPGVPNKDLTLAEAKVYLRNVPGGKDGVLKSGAFTGTQYTDQWIEDPAPPPTED